MDIHELRWRSMDRIDLAQDRDRWEALADVVINFRFREMRGIS